MHRAQRRQSNGSDCRRNIEGGPGHLARCFPRSEMKACFNNHLPVPACRPGETSPSKGGDKNDEDENNTTIIMKTTEWNANQGCTKLPRGYEANGSKGMRFPVWVEIPMSRKPSLVEMLQRGS